jgi:hypothetical protein
MQLPRQLENAVRSPGKLLLDTDALQIVRRMDENSRLFIPFGTDTLMRFVPVLFTATISPFVLLNNAKSIYLSAKVYFFYGIL